MPFSMHETAVHGFVAFQFRQLTHDLLFIPAFLLGSITFCLGGTPE